MLLHYPIIRASDPLCFPQQSFTDAVPFFSCRPVMQMFNTAVKMSVIRSRVHGQPIRDVQLLSMY